MAYQNSNFILGQLRGAIGKQLVVKQYKTKTVVAKFPDMHFMKKSKLQGLYQQRFARAVAYAQSILRKPEKKKDYAKTLKKGMSVYQAAIREYLAKNPF